MLFESVELILKELGPPFSNDNEVIEEIIFARVKLVVCFLFVSVQDLDEWGSEVPVIDLVNGLDCTVVKGSHGLSVSVELLEDLHLVVVEFASCCHVLMLKELLHFLDEESLGDIEEALLGANDLLVVELVVVAHGFLVLDPLGVLALVDLVGGINNHIFELLELLEDLSLNLLIVVRSLVSVELLGEVRDLSPEVVLLLRELVSNDFSGISAGLVDFLLVNHCLHLNTFTDELDTFAEGVGSHGEGLLGSSSSEVDFFLLILFKLGDAFHNLCAPRVEGAGHLDDDQGELLGEPLEGLELDGGLVDVVAGRVVVVGVLLVADLGESSLEVFNMSFQPLLDFSGKCFSNEGLFVERVFEIN